jgi:tetratricopeptide (TPR) repeat protein
MALKPEERYASALALADDLERWRAGEPVSAWREPWAVRTRRWLGRHRTLVTAAATAVVAAGLILAVATVLLSAAYRKEQQARQETLRQEEEVRKQRDEARRRRDEARQQRDEAARAFFYLAPLMAEGMLQEEAIGVYERAIALYERLARDNPSDRGYRSGLAKTCHNLALLYEEHRGQRRAEALLTRAKGLFDALARETWDEAGLVSLFFHLPDAIGSQFSLGKIHLSLGGVCLGSDREKEAEEHLRKALALLGGLEGLVAPTLVHYEQARCLDALGEVLAATGRPRQAEDAYQQAITLLRELAARPHSAGRQAKLAQVLTRLAALWVEAKRFNDAAAYLGEARKIMIRLTGDHPNVFRFKAQYARVHFVSGKMLVAAGRERVAEQAFRAALALQEPLVKEHPTNASYKLDLASTCKRLADVCRTTAPDQAESMFRRVVGLYRQLAKDHPEGEYTLRKAEALATFGAFLLLTKRPQPGLTYLDEAIATLKAMPQQGPGQKKISAALAKFQRIRTIALDALKRSQGGKN